ncbi:MAG: o-succinylbenzoate--CoA ligase [Armatimonadota bacterium]|nr:o-succinylbenzoate--CoA ligase [Armatimonadota bacterium]
MLTPDWLAYRARVAGGRLALVAGDEHLTFADLDRRAAGLARRLAGLGVAAGDHVAVLLRNGPAYAETAFALARLGAVMVPLNTRLATPELAWQLADSGARWLLSEERLAAQARQAVGDGTVTPGASRLLLVEAVAREPEADARLQERIDLSQVQGIVYTSATTSRPKGAQLTFGNHWWNAAGSALHLGVRRDDAWLAVLPFYHVGGLALLWRCVLYGIPLVVHEGFDADAANRAIDAGGVTMVSVVATMLQRMLDARAHRPFPPSLRCVLLGGGPAADALLERCAALGVPVAPTYGLTEAASQVATLPPDEFARKRRAAGRPLFPVEVRIDAPPGAVGEILVRGPTVMVGYWNRPEETAHALRDGWLHTGDLGYLDADGDLVVVDRRDDLIVTGGENVYPSEVEAVLRAHPAVADAGVFGVPDPEWGQVVAAAVVARPGAQVDVAALQAFCAARLARFKVPRRIWVVDDLPRSTGGKLVRRALPAQVLATSVPAVGAGVASSVGGRGLRAGRADTDVCRAQEVASGRAHGVASSGRTGAPDLAAPPATRRAWVRDAFHAIAGRYDLLNHLLSGGAHLLWKRAAVRAAGLQRGGRAVDVCCGTGDLLVGLARVSGPGGRVVGVDFAPAMVAAARARLTRRRATGAAVVLADAEALPLRDGVVDAATIAFGLRNVARPAQALREMHRVLRPGGRVVVLEFGQPQPAWFRALYDLFSRTVIPRLGGWLSGRPDAYRYLHDSIRQWPDPERLSDLLREAGFADVRFRRLTRGIAVLHVATKA